MTPQQITDYFAHCASTPVHEAELARVFNAMQWNRRNPSHGALWHLLGGLLRAGWVVRWKDAAPATGRNDDVRMTHDRWPGARAGALWVGANCPGLGLAANGVRNGPVREFRDLWKVRPDRYVDGFGRADPTGTNGLYVGESLRRLLDRIKKEMCSGGRSQP